MIVACGGLPDSAKVNSADLIGEWCFVGQTINGHDLETSSIKTISDKPKAKPKLPL
jgi:hypothetical protein